MSNFTDETEASEEKPVTPVPESLNEDVSAEVTESQDTLVQSPDSAVTEGVSPEAVLPSADKRGPLHVKLQVYDGPLDILLELIKKNEMDIYDIKIAEIDPSKRMADTDRKNNKLELTW